MNNGDARLNQSQRNYALTIEHWNYLLKSFPKGIVVVDLETTGLSPLVHEIVEIGALKFLPERRIESFQVIVRPENLIPPEIIAIHGITNEMAQAGVIPKKAMEDFLAFLDQLPIVAHNAKFDAGFLLFSAHKLSIPFTDVPIYCSCHYARKSLPEMPNFKLGTLAEKLDIPLDNHHRALDDAYASAQVFVRSLATGTPVAKGFEFRTSSYSKKSLMPIPDNLKSLVRSAERNEVVGIIYNGGSFRNILRPVRPVAVLPLPQGTILYAHCLVSDMYKSFSLSKIRQVVSIDHPESLVQQLTNLTQKDTD